MLNTTKHTSTVKELQILEKPQAFDALIIIAETPGINKDSVYSKLPGSRRTSFDRIKELTNENFIKERKNPKTNKNGLYLTDKGQRIAELAIRMKNVIEDITEESENNNQSSSEENGNKVTEWQQTKRKKTIIF